MPLVFNTYAFALFISSCFTSALFYYTWRKRYLKGAFSLSLLAVSITIWCLMAMFEVAVQDMPIRIIFAKLSFVGIVLACPFWLIFTLDNSGLLQKFTRKWLLALLFIIPFAVLIAVATNELHTSFWTKIIEIESAPFLNVVYEHGWMFTVHAVYSYSCLALGGFVLVRQLVKADDIQRKKIPLLLIALLIPWLANGFSIFEYNPFLGIDFTPLAFAVSVVLFGSAILKFNLFEALPSSESQLIAELENGIIILNSQLFVVEVNIAAQKLFGNLLTISSSADTVFSKWPNIIHALKVNTSQTVEITYNDGVNTKYFEIRIIPLLGDNGKTSQILMMLRDISNLKSAEQGLINTEHKLSEIINSLPDGAFVIDLKGRVTMWNRSMQDITGITAEQVLYKENHELAWLMYHERRHLMIDVAITGDESVLNKYEEVHKEDGQYSSVSHFKELNGRSNVSLWILAKKMTDADGNVIGAVETVRDISARKLADQEAITARSTLKAVVENTKDIIVYFDKDWRVITFNKAYVEAVEKFFGQEVKQGDDYRKYIFPGKEAWWIQNVERALKGESFIAELDYQDLNTTVTFEVSFNPVLIDNEVVGISNFIRDVSERKKGELLLQEKILELAKANEIMIGRELKMIELKAELEKLKGSSIEVKP